MEFSKIILTCTQIEYYLQMIDDPHFKFNPININGHLYIS